MRAVVCREFGPPENLRVEELAEPSPGPGELLVEVRAASATFPDALLVQDKYQYKAELPFVPGGETAGVVIALGEGVSGFEPGDPVCCGMLSGGFAERAVAKVAAVRQLPAGLDFAAAPGLLYSYGTALYALRERGTIRPGESLLVLGAGGALGIAAIETGKLLGARVIAAASTSEKLELARARGADELIDYSCEDLKQRAKELTGGKGADLVFDSVGGDYAEAALRATAWEGRFLVIGFTAGIPRIPLNLPLLKGCQIVGVFLGAQSGRDPAWAQAMQQELDTLCAEGKLKPQVGRSYPLEQAPQALRDLIDRKALGRLVVAP
ncbi:MAG: NADPH:quinone oxidoreductase family protein [Myxococcota bacterium]|nr:NADPH:quinone oxidoreductase family protein [Myxococcota bacterium]